MLQFELFAYGSVSDWASRPEFIKHFFLERFKSRPTNKGTQVTPGLQQRKQLQSPSSQLLGTLMHVDQGQATAEETPAFASLSNKQKRRQQQQQQQLQGALMHADQGRQAAAEETHASASLSNKQKRRQQQQQQQLQGALMHADQGQTAAEETPASASLSNKQKRRQQQQQQQLQGALMHADQGQAAALRRHCLCLDLSNKQKRRYESVWSLASRYSWLNCYLVEGCCQSTSVKHGGGLCVFCL
ncbi:hypothetical protein CEUSTIGMA_g5360.t1 [Chlamydomonas eustigma]|uniref:Uncharacterized protein n=1 Tax=Chlamydomonas eustigma TaxID=1157962 RepID=A0A250X4A3_9CHLO|nr:hypothetical protein CEUSTIGMA_g5360.t1 [Chlamydomonas eustigma]|eukprot:GAX77918.1 hypothetical protein CEUSTIGMA_g5360.t1 [Chlamydomonas eustigma]